MTPKQKKKLARKAKTLKAMDAAGIRYETTDGIHYKTVTKKGHRVDIWPGTGTVIDLKNKRRGRGAEWLIAEHKRQGKNESSLRKTSFKKSPLQKDFKKRKDSIFAKIAMENAAGKKAREVHGI